MTTSNWEPFGRSFDFPILGGPRPISPHPPSGYYTHRKILNFTILAPMGTLVHNHPSGNGYIISDGVSKMWCQIMESEAPEGEHSNLNPVMTCDAYNPSYYTHNNGYYNFTSAEDSHPHPPPPPQPYSYPVPDTLPESEISLMANPTRQDWQRSLLENAPNSGREGNQWSPRLFRNIPTQRKSHKKKSKNPKTLSSGKSTDENEELPLESCISSDPPATRPPKFAFSHPFPAQRNRKNLKSRALSVSSPLSNDILTSPSDSIPSPSSKNIQKSRSNDSIQLEPEILCETSADPPTSPIPSHNENTILESSLTPPISPVLPMDDVPKPLTPSPREFTPAENIPESRFNPFAIEYVPVMNNSRPPNHLPLLSILPSNFRRQNTAPPTASNLLTLGTHLNFPVIQTAPSTYTDLITQQSNAGPATYPRLPEQPPNFPIYSATVPTLRALPPSPYHLPRVVHPYKSFQSPETGEWFFVYRQSDFFHY